MLRLSLTLPPLLLVALFAVSNRGDATLGLWPTDFRVTAPLSLVVLGAMSIAFLAGALVAGAGTLRQRRRALAAERRADTLAAQLPRAVPPSPAPGGVGPAPVLPPAMPAGLSRPVAGAGP